MNMGKEPLRYPLKANNSNALRTDGYYYYEGHDDFSDKANHLLVLYKNGVSYGDINTSRYYRSGIDLDTNKIGSVRNSISLWGAYRILHDDQIEIQTWGPCAACSATMNIYLGDILSDTSFQLYSRRHYFNDTSFTEDKLDELYRFRPLKAKPDSTNDFVPEKD
jgi:hypothetical protein